MVSLQITDDHNCIGFHCNLIPPIVSDTFYTELSMVNLDLFIVSQNVVRGTLEES